MEGRAVLAASCSYSYCTGEQYYTGKDSDMLSVHVYIIINNGICCRTGTNSYFIIN